MGVPFWVNGAAGVLYNGALLGYGVDGTEEELTPVHHDVMFDVGGGSGGKPGDVQFMNEDATIGIALVAIGWNVLFDAIRNARAGAPPGIMPPSGILLGAGGFLKSLQILSPLGGRPITYATTYLVSPTRIPRGTVNTVIACTFRAIVLADEFDTLAGGLLYGG